MINLCDSNWVNDKYNSFYKKNNYLPHYFDIYNGLELIDYACTISTRSNGAMGSGTILILEEVQDGEE